MRLICHAASDRPRATRDINGNEELEFANAQSENGYYDFSALWTAFVVPSEPENNDDQAWGGIYSGLLQQNGVCNAIMQPALTWNYGENVGGAQHQYWIQAGYNDPTGYYFAETYEVPVNDTIYAYTTYVGYNEYALEIIDADNTSLDSFMYYTPYCDYPFNVAVGEALEWYGTPGNNQYPASCNDMPASKALASTITLAYQFDGEGGTVEVTPSWFGEKEAEQPASCNWGWSNGTSDVRLTW